jgi:DNA-binding beta-propeller fold protein YncE
MDGATKIINTVAGNGTFRFLGDGGPALAATLFSPEGIATDPAGNIFVADSANHRIRKIAAGTDIITTVAGNGQQCGFGYVGCFSGDNGLATPCESKLPKGDCD